MIKDIEELSRKKLSYIEEFAEECTITEKIDTFYVCVEIISKKNIIFRKANNMKISRVDMFINSMWTKFVNDWEHFRLVNQEWFDTHVGYKIYMFFFPSVKPLSTEYKSNVSYIIDRVVFDKETFNPESVMWKMNMLDKFNIHFKQMCAKQNMAEQFSVSTALMNSDLSLQEIFESKVIDIKNSNIFAVDKPEGFILKHKKNIYQINYKKDKEQPKSEMSQYEFLLMDFSKFWSQYDGWMMLENDYFKTVCCLFNAYIINKESQTNYIADNVDIESLKNPNMGQRFACSYDYVPNEITIKLCKNNELYECIFKILLINLKKKKNISRCILMNKKNVEDWNNIVNSILQRCFID